LVSVSGWKTTSKTRHSAPSEIKTTRGEMEQDPESEQKPESKTSN
jgi:hypothetical protein